MTRILSESYELGVQTLRCRVSGGTVFSTAGLNLNGTYCLSMGNANIEYTNVGSETDTYTSFFFRLATVAPVDENNINSIVFKYYSATSVEMGSLRYNGITQKLSLCTGTATIVATGTQTLSTGSTYHIQMRHKVDNAAGIFELYVNAGLDATFTGDTQPAAETFVEFIRFVAPTFGNSFYIDDVLMNNSLGATDNTYTGIVRIASALVPAGVGFYVNNWSRNTGATNWQAVDEIPNDGDTTYIFTGSPNIYESFSMSDQSLVSVNYMALTTNAVVKKDLGTVQLALGIRDVQNSVNYYGVNSALGVSYGLVSERRTVDPATGLAWTSGRLNSVESLVVSTSG